MPPVCETVTVGTGFRLLVCMHPYSVLSDSLQPHGLQPAKAPVSVGVAIPLSGDLPNPRIKLISPALADRFFTTVPPGKTLETAEVC